MTTAPRRVSDLTITELDADIVRLDSLLKQQQSNVVDTRNQLALVRGELGRRARGASEPKLSDHALIRFLERSMGIDVDTIRSRLLSETVKAAIKAGAATITVDGVRLKVQENVIVTVLEPESASHRKGAAIKPRKGDRYVEDGPSLKEGLAEHFDELADALVK